MNTGTRVLIASLTLLAATSSSVCAAGEKANKDQIERGRYLANTGLCHDCHSPKIFTAAGPEPDMTKPLSGHPADSPLPPIDARAFKPGYWVLMSSDFTAFVGPWGVSYAANLTPDEQTGIGLWTEDHFIKALRTGKHMGDGRDILPPMPWQFFREMPDADLKAIFAYLKSLPPVKNPVPAPMAPTAGASGQQ